MAYFLISGEESTAGGAKFIANRMVLPFEKGTEKFKGKVNAGQGGNKDWNSFIGWAKNEAGEKVATQISQRAFNLAKEKGLAVKHPTGWVITVAATVGTDGWFKNEVLQGSSFNSADVANELTASENGTAVVVVTNANSVL